MGPHKVRLVGESCCQVNFIQPSGARPPYNSNGSSQNGISGTQVALNCFHVVKVEIVGGGRSVTVPNDGLNMLDGLSDRQAGNADALGSGGAEHDLAGESLLHPALRKGCLKERPHDGSGLFLSERGCHERVLQSFHDGAIQAVPGVGCIDTLGPDSIDPLGYLGLHGLDLVFH